MLSYFDIETLSVIDICNLLAYSDLDFVIATVKMSGPNHPSRNIFEISAI
jgi:hypothetical protein